ncbi:TIGR01457 family HAD-type hydrolase, partial [Staphylococcus aureus]|nr:TIGR01457 family HAD-type hydrolase [Staphylococcus aureus]
EEIKEKDQQPTYSFKDLNVAISELERNAQK